MRVVHPETGDLELRYSHEFDQEPIPKSSAFMVIETIPRELAESALCLAVELYGMPPTEEKHVWDCYCEGAQLTRCILAQGRLDTGEWESEHDLKEEQYEIFKGSTSSIDDTYHHSTGRRAECFSTRPEAARWEPRCPFHGDDLVFERGRLSYRILELVSEGSEGDVHTPFGVEHLDQHPFVLVNSVPASFMESLTVEEWRHVRGIEQHGNPIAEQCYHAVGDFVHVPSSPTEEEISLLSELALSVSLGKLRKESTRRLLIGCPEKIE